jgi:phospholipase/carboxylesterase
MKQAELSLHHIVRPPASGEGGPPPLIILLHGIGSNEEDLFSLAPMLPAGCLVVSVRSRLTLAPGSYAWYHVDFAPGRMDIHADEEAESREAILSFIDEAAQAYGADASRVFLMGFSQGAIMSLGIMLTHPEKIAGVAALSGRLLDEVKPQAVSPEKLDGFPVMLAHGMADETIPIRYAREAMEYLHKLPVKLFYREYGMGHTITDASLADVVEWLQQRLGEA